MYQEDSQTLNPQEDRNATIDAYQKRLEAKYRELAQQTVKPRDDLCAALVYVAFMGAQKEHIKRDQFQNRTEVNAYLRRHRQIMSLRTVHPGGNHETKRPRHLHHPKGTVRQASESQTL